MKCRVCGGFQEAKVTDTPFKTGDSSIVVLKALPVLQCVQCGEIELEHAVMVKVEQVLSAVDRSSELKVVRYAA
jgi:YgiT-type zinc finger domain-containing protein